MEAHNCEYAGVHVPCEIVIRFGDLGVEYLREQARQASFLTPGDIAVNRGSYPLHRLHFTDYARQNRNRPEPCGFGNAFDLSILERIDKTGRYVIPIS